MVRAVLLLAALAPAAAFLAPPLATSRAPAALRMALDDDITAAEQAAIAATKKFGARSPEAANAWDNYEEVAASDNSAASKPSLDQSCDTDNFDCAEFDAQMAELQGLINGGKPVTTEALVEQNKKLIEENQRLRRSLSAYK